MERVSAQPYASADLEGSVALLRAWRVACAPDHELTTGRLRLLLISRLWEPERNARLWRDEETGELRGFVALLQRWQRTPHLGLLHIVHPDAPEPLRDELFAWAAQRAGDIATELGQPVSLGDSVREDDAAYAAFLEVQGFARQDGAHNVLMRCSLERLLPDVVLPQGYTVREVAGEGEIEAYTDLYNSVSSPMSAEQRHMLMRYPSYDPRLHLVAVAPDGRPAAFCEGSADADEWALSGLRGGWVEHVGTHPDYQGRGLGRAVTLACLHRLQALGATQATLVTRSDNAIAQHIYRSLGFTIFAREWPYTRMIPLP
jgi:ribosomal protein S18 acetylase RimI-like enzyme